MSFKALIIDGIWRKNPSIIQLLGMCPLLAVSNTFTNAASLGIATIIVMASSSLLISLFKNLIPSEIRLPTFIAIIAANVSIIDMLWKAYYFDMYQKIGIFIPLIVTNCIVLARAEAFASKKHSLESLLDGISMGIGILISISILGSIRELLSSGAIIIFKYHIKIFPKAYAPLIFSFPAGGFIVLAALMAIKNYIDEIKS